MIGVHKETYNIDGQEYTAVVDFHNENGFIYGRQFKQEFNLDEYVNFEGNMEDFVAYQLRRK